MVAQSWAGLWTLPPWGCGGLGKPPPEFSMPINLFQAIGKKTGQESDEKHKETIFL